MGCVRASGASDSILVRGQPRTPHEVFLEVETASQPAALKLLFNSLRKMFHFTRGSLQ